MTHFAAITRSGARVSIPYAPGWIGPCPVVFEGHSGRQTVFLPADAGQGLDLVAADVGDDVWAVCTGGADRHDRAYLLTYRDGSVTRLGSGPVCGRYRVWVTEDGDVSWVECADPTHVQHLDGRVTDARDTEHPLSPDGAARADLGSGVVVTRVCQAGGWTLGEDITAPDGVTRLFARFGQQPVEHVWTGYAPLPAQLTAHDDGSCTVAVPIPARESEPLFLHSSGFTPYTRPSVTLPAFRPQPHRLTVVVDGEPGVPWFAAPGPWAGEQLGVLLDLKDKAEIAAYVALARSPRRVLYVYADTPYPTAGMFHGLGLPADVAWMPMGQVYPLRGETAGAFASRVRLICQMLDAFDRPWGLYACGYLGLDSPEGTRTEQQVVTGLGIVAETLRDFPACRLVAVFTHARGTDDGVSRSPSIAATVMAWQAAARAADYPTPDEIAGSGSGVPGDAEAGRQPSIPDGPSAPSTPLPVPAQETPMPPTHRHGLEPGQWLSLEQWLSSPNGRYDLVLQHDGNLVLYTQGGVPLWASATSGQLVQDLSMQEDGNLVLYRPDGTPIWASGTGGNPGAELVLQDDGNVVLYRHGTPIWATNTAQPPDVSQPSAPSTPAPVLTRLRVDGRRIVTSDGRPFVWRGVTAFRLVHDVARGDEARARAYLAWAAATGFDLVRVLTTAVHLFDLSPGDGRRALPRLLELAAEYGLYVEVVAIADSASRGYDIRDHARQVARLCADVPHATYAFANEPYHPTQHKDLHDPAETQRLAEAAVAGLDLLWTAGPAANDEDHVAPLGAYVVRHLDRGRDKWNQVRRVWEIGYVQEHSGKPAVSDEPIGFDELDGSQTGRQRLNDPDIALTFGVLHRITATGMTFHLQAGLQCDIPGPVQQRCAADFVAGTRIVPDDVVLRRKNARWADSPVADAQFVDGDVTRVVRVYTGIDGDSGVTIALGIARDRVTGAPLDPGIRWQHGWSIRETLVDRAAVKVWRIGA